MHYNMPLEQQVHTVQKVKQQAVGFVANPIVLSRDMLPGTHQEKQVPCLMHASKWGCLVAFDLLTCCNRRQAGIGHPMPCVSLCVWLCLCFQDASGVEQATVISLTPRYVACMCSTPNAHPAWSYGCLGLRMRFRIEVACFCTFELSICGKCFRLLVSALLL